MDMQHKKGAEAGRMTGDELHRLEPYTGNLERDGDAEHDENADGIDRIPVRRGREAIVVSRQGARWYRLEKISCGKKSCRCARGELHGPYWYVYYRENGRMRCEYMGKSLPEHVRLENLARRACKSSEAERERAAKIVAQVKDTLNRARGL
jgi:hypothetical protein